MTKNEMMSILGGYNLSMAQVEKTIDEYAQSVAKQAALDFAEWLAEMTEIIRDDNITLYRYYHIGDSQHGNYTLDDIYLEYLEHLKRTP